MPNSMSNLNRSNSNESLKELNQNQVQHSQVSEADVSSAAGVIASQFNEAATLPAATVPVGNKSQRSEIDFSDDEVSPPSSKKLKTDPNQRPSLQIETAIDSEIKALSDFFKKPETGIDLLENLLQLNAISINAPTSKNAELIETLNSFFSKNEGRVGESVFVFFKQIQQAMSTIQQTMDSQMTPLKKANSLLAIAERKVLDRCVGVYLIDITERYSSAADVTSLNPGVFEQTASKEGQQEFLQQKIAKAVTNLSLSAMRETLQDYESSGLTDRGVSLNMRTLLERVVVLKTTTGLIDGSLEQDIDTLLNVVNRLPAPLQNHAGQGHSFSYLNYQIKMRAYLVAAHALVKMGGEQNRNKAIELIEMMKPLYAGGLHQIQYIGRHDLPHVEALDGRVFVRVMRPSSMHQRRVLPMEFDELMAKGLTVQVMTGQAREAFDYIFSGQHSPEKQIETLLRVSELGKKNSTESDGASWNATLKTALQNAHKYIQELGTEDLTNEKKRALSARLAAEIEKFY